MRLKPEWICLWVMGLLSITLFIAGPFLLFNLAYERPVHSQLSLVRLAFNAGSFIYSPWFYEMDDTNLWRRSYLGYVRAKCNEKPGACSET